MQLVTDRAVKFLALWQAVSDVEPPDLAQFARWCMKFDDAVMERAVMKAGAKFNHSHADAERTYRYTTRLLQNLYDERPTQINQ